jgi:hypothetical protein
MKLTTHHRKARYNGGGDQPSNLIQVPENKHQAFHLLFNEGEPHHIRNVLNKIWIDPAYRFILVKRKNK